MPVVVVNAAKPVYVSARYRDPVDSAQGFWLHINGLGEVELSEAEAKKLGRFLLFGDDSNPETEDG